MIKVAVIGLGRMGKLHMMNCLHMNDVKVVSNADQSKEALESASSIDIKNLYADYHDMLREHVGFDMVIMCLPNVFHFESIQLAIEAGLNVFVEKPLATTVEKCSKIVKLVKESGRKLTIGHSSRFLDAIEKMKAITDRGRIGDLRIARAIHSGPVRILENVKVTIGLCVKNVEITVRKAIASIIHQDFPHACLEIIVVDGFSEDKTLSIVERSLQGSDIDYRVFKENEGLGPARQMVVDNALGKYIVWVDGDMDISKTFVRKQVEFMEENPSVGIAGGKYGLCLSNNLVADLENVVYAVDSVYGEKGASKLGHLPGTEGAIYRIEAIRQVGGFDTHIKGAAEDIELVSRLRTKGWRVAVTDEVFTESTRGSWISLWNQYFWYGYGGHYVFHKDCRIITLWKMTPMAGFVAGLLRFSGAYKLTQRKIMLLLPIHYVFKRMAWFLGFVTAHANRY